MIRAAPKTKIKGKEEESLYLTIRVPQYLFTYLCIYHRSFCAGLSSFAPLSSSIFSLPTLSPFTTHPPTLRPVHYYANEGAWSSGSPAGLLHYDGRMGCQLL